MTCRGNESFDTHIWMLQKFISFKSEENQLPLEYYIISASYEKMLSRMDHSISRHYLRCLKSLKGQDFLFNPDMSWVEKCGRNDDELINLVIPAIAPHTTLEIPNLLKAAEVMKGVKAGKGADSGIYNESTCREFHLLLCDSLDRFHSSLEDLLTFRKIFPPSSPKSLTVEQLKKLKMLLSIVQVLGNILRAIVRSEAHHKHLATIERFLERYAGNMRTPRDNEEDEEEDEELQGLDPPGGITVLRQLYGDWSKLMVGYVDATRLIRQYVGLLPGDPSGNVSIQILASPCSGKRMLPWKVLLKTKDYFPEHRNGSKNEPTMDELIEFLISDVRFDLKTSSECSDSEQVKRGTIKCLAKAFKEFEETITKGALDVCDYIKAVDSFILDASRLRDCSSPGWHDYVEEIVEQLRGLKDIHGKQARLRAIGEVAKMLKTLRGHSLLFQRLKPGSPLSIGIGFKGSQHCESSLACLTSTPLDQVLDSNIMDQNVLKAFEVSCISMRYFLWLKNFHPIGNWTDNRGV
jgi:hypothetical protein